MAAGRKEAGGRDGEKTGKGNAGMAEAKFGSIWEPTKIDTQPWGVDTN